MGINKFNAEGYYDPTCYEACSISLMSIRNMQQILY